MGIGTFGSRSAQLAGSAIVVAADRLIDKGRKIAAHMMEAACTTSLSRTASSRSPAPTARSASSTSPGSLSTRRSCPTVSRPAFPSAPISARRMRHLSQRRPSCEVEIDEETGAVVLTRYVAVDDVGRVLNPLLCEGQIHGGIVQGVGQALMEDLVYDPASGQL